MEESKFTKQELITLSHTDSYLINDYIITQCNKEAIDATLLPEIGLKPYQQILHVKGGESSGKTFLCKYVAAKKNGIFILNATTAVASRNKYLIVDDADKYEESEIFHIINTCAENNKNLLIVSGNSWKPSLKDLQSRLNVIKTVSIDEPDDEMMEVIIGSEFSKRSVTIKKDVILYLKTRLPRDFSNIKNIIEEIDNFCLKNKKNVNVRTLSEFFSKNFTQILT